MNNVLQIHTLQDLSYQQVWDFQEILMQKLIQSKKSEGDTRVHHLIFCEHRPVYTLGKSGSIDNLLRSVPDLQSEDFEFFKINRGGDITYHGPGQWTVYIIIDLECFYRDVHKFVRSIELMVIDTLKAYGIEGFPIDEFTGVWTGDEVKRKLCAIGVHLSRWVSMHGLALNVNTTLSHFRNIVPCGISTPDKTVTSISQELDRSVDMSQVKQILTQHFLNYFPMDSILDD